MKLTFLGHESWYLQTGKLQILVDPILEETFGSGSKSSFVFSPNRKIEASLYQNIDLIFLTSEHFQHFDVRSLQKLNKNAIVYIPHGFSFNASSLIEELGFKVIRTPRISIFEVSDIEFTFFQSPTGNLVWDDTVASLAICEKDGKTNPWVFFQSDCKLVEDFSIISKTTWSKRPTFAVLTHHAKFPLPAGLSWRDNYLLPENSEVSWSSLLARSRAILPKENSLLRCSDLFIIAGGGYRRHDLLEPAAEWNNETLSQFIQPFLMNSSAVGPKPGDQYALESGKINYLRNPQVEVRPAENIAGKIRDAFEVKSIRTAYSRSEQEILEELNQFVARRLLVSEFGESLVFVDWHLEGRTGPIRFCLQLLDDSEPLQFNYDLTSSVFTAVPFSDDSALANFPTGLQIYRSDFDSLLDGEVSIGEISYSGTLQWWNTNDVERSPTGMFLTIFSECYSEKYSKLKYDKLRRILNKN